MDPVFYNNFVDRLFVETSQSMNDSREQMPVN